MFLAIQLWAGVFLGTLILAILGGYLSTLKKNPNPQTPRPFIQPHFSRTAANHDVIGHRHKVA